MKSNDFLLKAKKNKNDEFYTLLKDIESELEHYQKLFENKTVLCNCDNPQKSNFYKYFVDNFEKLGLNRVIASCYQQDSTGFYYIYDGQNKKFPDTDVLILFNQDGDFRSLEAVELLKQSDIVVTNPPFSLFREYIEQLMNYEKQFLIIGNINGMTYKDVFPYFQQDKLWLGYGFGRGISGFIVPENYELYGTETLVDSNNNRIISPNNCCWFTNLPNDKRTKTLDLTETYVSNEQNYLFYDNYPAINIDKTNKIPKDYVGVMGVPITFLNKYCPEQFEIIRFRKGTDNKDLSVNGKSKYCRILIKNKQPIY